ncbi:hypothetical protein BAOM_3235 [Peribacillus asahii]|jgi:hypothetical protein|uniref:Uncharacterized protein n=1 Tax=Peribacillus asahii TaxID=228899 RepID=A0A3Q9RPE7_9BACI|nr:hypothetical protein BAOM_3235 [Peribacillus asahii]
MLMVCHKHVKEGLKRLTIPHVKKIKDCHCSCLYCNRKAEIKIFYSMPFFNMKKFYEHE